MSAAHEEMESHIESERQRYDAQFGAINPDRNLVVKYGTEFAPNDLRAAMVYAFNQTGDLRGKKVLELGAGTGWHAAMLVHRGAYVVATDVSPVGVELSQRRFEANGMTDQSETMVVAAERMPFEDSSFDCLFGCAVLHHLEMEFAGPEIARVLKPSGRAVFLEPLSENPVLDFVRDYVPYPGKKSPKGHRGVTYAMIDAMRHHFAAVEVREFYLTSMINRAIGQKTAITPLEALDNRLLKRFPALRRFSRSVVITCVNR